MEFGLDRTAFRAGRVSQQKTYRAQYAGTTPEERGRIAAYLRSQVYRYPLNDLPRMDKTIFKARSRK